MSGTNGGEWATRLAPAEVTTNSRNQQHSLELGMIFSPLFSFFGYSLLAISENCREFSKSNKNRVWLSPSN